MVVITMRVVVGTLGLLLLARRDNAQIRYSTDLNCDFASECRWHNATSQPPLLYWSHTNDVMADLRFPASAADRTNDFIFTQGPVSRRLRATMAIGRQSSSVFRLVCSYIQPGMHQIELVSDIVSCQLGGARFSFWYFYSGPRARLDVCTRWPPGSMDPLRRHCYEPTAPVSRGAQWTLAAVELPPMAQSMDYEPPHDVVAVDDLKYDAILCETTHRFGSSSGGGGEIDERAPIDAPPLGSHVRQLSSVGYTLDSAHEILDVADAVDAADVAVPVTVDDADGEQKLPPRSPFVERSDFESRRADNSRRHSPPSVVASHSNCGFDCDFDTSTFCQLANGNENDDETAAWTIGASAMWNAITGIESDASQKGFFASTPRDSHPHRRYVLGSAANMTLLEPTTLSFSYYNGGVRGRLRVCTDWPVAASCPFQEEGIEMHVDWRQWRTAMIKLKPGRIKIHFVADRLPTNYVIGIDNLKLNDKFARLPALCDSKSAAIHDEDYFA